MQHFVTLTPQLTRELSRFFTGLPGALQELFQNCRRAQATAVQLTLQDQQLTLADNGTGLEDFQVLLQAGQSGWPNAVEPAGLGIFSTLGSFCEQVTFQSHHWKLTLTPQHLHGEPVTVERQHQPTPGFTVRLKLKPEAYQSLQPTPRGHFTVLQQAYAFHDFALWVKWEDHNAVQLPSPGVLRTLELEQATLRLNRKDFSQPQFRFIWEKQPLQGAEFQRAMHSVLQIHSSPLLRSLQSCCVQVSIEPRDCSGWQPKLPDRNDLEVTPTTLKMLKGILDEFRRWVVGKTRQHLQEHPGVLPHLVPPACDGVLHPLALQELGVEVVRYTTLKSPWARHHEGEGWTFMDTQTVHWSGEPMWVRSIAATDTINHLFMLGKVPVPAVFSMDGLPVTLIGELTPEQHSCHVQSIQVGELSLPYLIFTEHDLDPLDDVTAPQILLATVLPPLAFEALLNDEKTGPALLGMVARSWHQHDGLSLEEHSDGMDTDCTLDSHLKATLLQDLDQENADRHLQGQAVHDLLHQLKQVWLPLNPALPEALSSKLQDALNLLHTLRTEALACQAATAHPSAQPISPGTD